MQRDFCRLPKTFQSVASQVNKEVSTGFHALYYEAVVQLCNQEDVADWQVSIQQQQPLAQKQ